LEIGHGSENEGIDIEQNKKDKRKLSRSDISPEFSVECFRSERKAKKKATTKITFQYKTPFVPIIMEEKKSEEIFRTSTPLIPIEDESKSHRAKVSRIPSIYSTKSEFAFLFNYFDFFFFQKKKKKTRPRKILCKIFL